MTLGCKIFSGGRICNTYRHIQSETPSPNGKIHIINMKDLKLPSFSFVDSTLTLVFSEYILMTWNAYLYNLLEWNRSLSSMPDPRHCLPESVNLRPQPLYCIMKSLVCFFFPGLPKISGTFHGSWNLVEWISSVITF